MSHEPQDEEISRWQKAKDAELKHYTETADLQIVPEERAFEILNRWNIDFGFFDNKRVLAVGGGTGIIHHLLNSESAISLDPLNDSVFPTISNNSEAEGITGIGESLPFPDNLFDVVISANVIDHTADPDKTISEIARVLDSDGALLFDVNVFRARVWSRRIADFLDRPHPHHFDSIDVQELLLGYFDNVKLTSLNKIPFGASPSISGRLKLLIANTVFGIRKVCYICQISE